MSPAITPATGGRQRLWRTTMTPMSEIAKCRCGALDTGIDNDDGWDVTCNDCGCRGPFVPTYEEAIAAWNALMRPRPVAEWVPAQGLRGDEPHGFVGSLRLGQVVLGHVSVHGIVAARCHIDGKGQYFLDPDSASARA